MRLATSASLIPLEAGRGHPCMALQKIHQKFFKW
jgi:hypothetical protein